MPRWESCLQCGSPVACSWCRFQSALRRAGGVGEIAAVVVTLRPWCWQRGAGRSEGLRLPHSGAAQRLCPDSGCLVVLAQSCVSWWRPLWR
ncbi:hypothetical protein HBI56_150760 [Parastagonospora nodorum]|uniref:Uncharacterized protein n=1 Tax=Phaeosphaeria nodorum (strain SN15 / ATCC MYA-4574 / FGSC 10173) TaxID=321614 RepID=A0A7U2I6W9_PHANO|nr:hypothetical protein HBH56_183760 [Parastagonospora nodorum]QRD04115.1 hypothetical protein JI435_420740 [Parastagonospora nodorum SN15]KAH3926121.1 hypothetical protein HBH54_172910 [Parastagonospora nodorum]KAH3944799.1 hypothetical protein HBH53_152020 [Parastagonospora nodorum]KAH3962391.1 hypothetical protein HBH52_224410 [Parastagonospora nodorum]